MIVQTPSDCEFCTWFSSHIWQWKLTIWRWGSFCLPEPWAGWLALSFYVPRSVQGQSRAFKSQSNRFNRIQSIRCVILEILELPRCTVFYWIMMRWLLGVWANMSEPLRGWKNRLLKWVSLQSLIFRPVLWVWKMQFSATSWKNRETNTTINPIWQPSPIEFDLT